MSNLGCKLLNEVQSTYENMIPFMDTPHSGWRLCNSNHVIHPAASCCRAHNIEDLQSQLWQI